MGVVPGLEKAEDFIKLIQQNYLQMKPVGRSSLDETNEVIGIYVPLFKRKGCMLIPALDLTWLFSISLGQNAGAIKLSDRKWSVLKSPKYLRIGKNKTVCTTIILHLFSRMNGNKVYDGWIHKAFL
jgi:hypothetical protein